MQLVISLKHHIYNTQNKYCVSQFNWFFVYFNIIFNILDNLHILHKEYIVYVENMETIQVDISLKTIVQPCFKFFKAGIWKNYVSVE